MMQGHNWKWRRWEQWQPLGRWRLSSRPCSMQADRSGMPTRHMHTTYYAFLQLRLVHFFVANTRVKWKGTPPALSVSHVWSLWGHVQCCGDTRRWADIPGPSPMDRGNQMPSQESWSTTVLAALGTPCQLNVSGLLAGWSLTQQQKEDGGTAMDGLTVFNRAFSLLKLEIIGRKIMNVVAFYVACSSSKQEWSHITWGSIRNVMPSNHSLMATWVFLFFNLLFNLTMAVYAKMRNAVQNKFTYWES